jgi:hypothetical protein
MGWGRWSGFSSQLGRMQSGVNKHLASVVVHAMSKCGRPPLLNSVLFNSLTIVLCIRDDVGFVLSLTLFLRFMLVDT